VGRDPVVESREGLAAGDMSGVELQDRLEDRAERGILGTERAVSVVNSALPKCSTEAQSAVALETTAVCSGAGAFLTFGCGFTGTDSQLLAWVKKSAIDTRRPMKATIA
jgi:hypothetical protein